MQRRTIVIRFLIAAAVATAPTAALADQCLRSEGIMPYCKCLYEDALDRIMEKQGTSTSSIKQRIEAAAKALKKCMNGGTDEAAEEMNKI